MSEREREGRGGEWCSGVVCDTVGVETHSGVLTFLVCVCVVLV